MECIPADDTNADLNVAIEMLGKHGPQSICEARMGQSVEKNTDLQTHSSLGTRAKLTHLGW